LQLFGEQRILRGLISGFGRWRVGFRFG
jgi:hypothetical protein